MLADMIEDIVEDIEAEYNVKVEVDYDFMPASTDSVLDLIDTVLDKEIGDWVASGETYVLYSKSGEKAHIDVLLLKRGVELHFEIPHSCKESVNNG